MRYRTFLSLFSIVLLSVAVSACSAFAHHRDGAKRHLASLTVPDPISGAWAVTFFVHDSKTPATFNLKLDGDKITGTAFSDHTGDGEIHDGVFKGGKLSFTLDFKKHESIAVTGALQDGVLAGEFKTEGFTDKWEAKRK